MVRLNRRVSGFSEDADGVTLNFADGSSTRGDLLIGADGLKSVVRRQIVGEVPDLATKNYFDSLMSGDEIALDVVHGTDAGNIVEFASSHLQITDIDLSEENDVLMLTISYGLNVGTTPDDLIITAK